jgi:hypothetical protein
MIELAEPAWGILLLYVWEAVAVFFFANSPLLAFANMKLSNSRNYLEYDELMIKNL